MHLFRCTVVCSGAGELFVGTALNEQMTFVVVVEDVCQLNLGSRKRGGMVVVGSDDEFSQMRL